MTRQGEVCIPFIKYLQMLKHDFACILYGEVTRNVQGSIFSTSDQVRCITKSNKTISYKRLNWRSFHLVCAFYHL